MVVEARRILFMRNLLVMTGVLFCGFSAVALNRPADPIVLTGASVPTLQGIAPGNLVAFKFNNGWTQVPVQVDERAVINFTQVYNGNTTNGSLSRLDYTDAGTFTGPDPDAALDGDDEIVFMVKDAGQACGLHAAPPAGALADTAIRVAITDPVDATVGYVYLFEQDGTLDPGAGRQYVDYAFSLTAGDYKTKYKLGTGPNPENSTIDTDYYTRHFSDRWKLDGLSILAGSSTGVDILDRHKNLFAPGYCTRSEDTFSAAEGAFIVNKSGPVRALRSYIGANSGPRTQRQHVYYEQREDVTTHLRVHAIPAIMDFLDYSPEAAGMTYMNNNLQSALTIDGISDAATLPSETANAVQWELVRGEQGALAMLHNFSTNAAGLTVGSYYLDELTPAVTQCTGDTHAYGQSGHFIVGAPTSSLPEIPNTDPKTAGFKLFSLTRTVFYMAPGTTVANVLALQNLAAHPLTTAFQAQAFDADATVPDVVGQTQADASTAITAAGLTVGTITQVYSATVAPGRVVSQSLAAGATVGYGTAVNLTVSQSITGGIVINGNRSATLDPQVTLSLTWSAGVARMRFSNDGKIWSAWEALLATRAHTLPSGDGYKTVRVQYRDGAGNTSSAFSDYIRLDTTPPTGTIVINGDAPTTATPSVTLGLTWADAAGSGVTRMRFSNDGAHWSAWEPQATPRAHTLPGPIGYNTVRVQYRDGAGNTSDVFRDYIKLLAQ